MLRYENSINKFYVERDWSLGQEIKFQTIYPPILFGKIKKSVYLDTINNINHIYCEANSNSKALCFEFCFEFISFYTYSWCCLTNYQRKMKLIDQYIENQNLNIYHTQGIHIVSPSKRGHFALEIVCFKDFTEIEDII